MEYKKDKLLVGSKVIANIRQNKVCKGSGSGVICNVKSGYVMAGSGSKVVCNIRRGDVREGVGSRRATVVESIRRAIKNSNELSDELCAAAWFYFLR